MKKKLYKLLLISITLLFVIAPYIHIFLDKKSKVKIFGFKNARYFMYAIGTPLSLFLCSLFLLMATKHIKEKYNKSFYSTVSFLFTWSCFFQFIWIFWDRQDLPKPTYYFSIVILSVIISKVFIQFLHKRKSALDIAKSTIQQLEQEVFTKQKEEREKERQRISEELHDGVLGKLFGTRLGLGFLNIPEEADKEKYQQFLDELQEVEKEIREVSHKLSANLDGSDIGFEGIVTQLVKDKSKLGNFEYTLNTDVTINWSSVNEVNRVNLYRIIQEALQNIIKHAKANHVTLTFSTQNGHILISIEDNGVGFNTSKNRNGIGINNIKSRVKRLNATMELVSSPKNGTTIQIKMPYMIKEFVG
ncbi:Oxygen sensor histidine kinase NreB (modular protein) [Tenacibaculum sp. 190524A02b]|uniref:sensor histidine kinase n=1 Tax=Tenacibaculum vairaonense TaxID=3137860 RepID=UPI0032B2A8FD